MATLKTIDDIHVILPEHELMISLIERAIMDILDPTIGLEQHYRRQAKWWLKTNTIFLYSFMYCCHHLAENPEGLASKIRNLVFPKFIKPAKSKRRTHRR